MAHRACAGACAIARTSHIYRAVQCKIFHSVVGERRDKTSGEKVAERSPDSTLPDLTHPIVLPNLPNLPDLDHPIVLPNLPDLTHPIVLPNLPDLDHPIV